MLAVTAYFQACFQIIDQYRLTFLESLSESNHPVVILDPRNSLMRRPSIKKSVNKVPLGQFESPLNLQPMPLVWLVEESPDFKDMLKEQSISVRQDAEIIENIPSKRYKSLNSWFNDAKARNELHPLIIMQIIATIESLQSMKLKSKVKNSPKIEKGLATQIKNIPDVIYWYDRLLPLLKVS